MDKYGQTLPNSFLLSLARWRTYATATSLRALKFSLATKWQYKVELVICFGGGELLPRCQVTDTFTAVAF